MFGGNKDSELYHFTILLNSEESLFDFLGVSQHALVSKKNGAVDVIIVSSEKDPRCRILGEIQFYFGEISLFTE